MNHKTHRAVNSGKSYSPINDQLFLQGKDNQSFVKKQADYHIIRNHFGIQSILHSYISNKNIGGREI